MNKILAWILVSSSDPRKFFLTVKAALVALIPYSIHLIDLSCRFGLACLGVDADALNQFAEIVTNLAFYITSAIAAGMAAYGFLRKVYLSLVGRNRSTEGVE